MNHNIAIVGMGDHISTGAMGRVLIDTGLINGCDSLIQDYLVRKKYPESEHDQVQMGIIDAAHLRGLSIEEMLSQLDDIDRPVVTFDSLSHIEPLLYQMNYRDGYEYEKIVIIDPSVKFYHHYQNMRRRHWKSRNKK